MAYHVPCVLQLEESQVTLERERRMAEETLEEERREAGALQEQERHRNMEEMEQLQTQVSVKDYIVWLIMFLVCYSWRRVK